MTQQKQFRTLDLTLINRFDSDRYRYLIHCFVRLFSKHFEELILPYDIHYTHKLCNMVVHNNKYKKIKCMSMSQLNQARNNKKEKKYKDIDIEVIYNMSPRLFCKQWSENELYENNKVSVGMSWENYEIFKEHNLPVKLIPRNSTFTMNDILNNHWNIPLSFQYLIYNNYFSSMLYENSIDICKIRSRYKIIDNDVFLDFLKKIPKIYKNIHATVFNRRCENIQKFIKTHKKHLPHNSDILFKKYRKETLIKVIKHTIKHIKNRELHRKRRKKLKN